MFSSMISPSNKKHVLCFSLQNITNTLDYRLKNIYRFFRVLKNYEHCSV